MTRNKSPLQLDRENAKWLGVCAGVANYLEVQPWTVRLIFLGCILFGGWFLVPMYFIMWYLLDENSGQLRGKIMDNHTVKHFRNVDYRKKLYRNTRDGKLMGVCAGIADYFEVSAFTVRIIFFVLTFLTVFPVLFYIGAWMILEKKPDEEYHYEEASRAWATQFDSAEERSSARTSADGEQAFTRAQARGKADPRPRDQYSKRREFQYAVRKFSALGQRLARLEAYVTSNRFKLHREFRNMS
jgi:phage shock protein C